MHPSSPTARHQHPGTSNAATLVSIVTNPGRRSLISPLNVLLHHSCQIPPCQRQCMPQGGQLGRQGEQARIGALNAHFFPHKHINRLFWPRTKQSYTIAGLLVMVWPRCVLLTGAAVAKHLFGLIVLEAASGADGQGELSAEVDGGIGGL